MKKEFIKVQIVLVFALSMSHQVYPLDSILVDTDEYRLVFIGRTPSLSELKSKFWAGYSFVNVPIDSSFYKLEYPNPFSPSTVKQQFLYQLKDSSSVTIKIIDANDSLYFNLNIDDRTPGYYYFILNYFKFSSFKQKVLSSLEDIRIVFLIEEKRISFPLRNIN